MLRSGHSTKFVAHINTLRSHIKLVSRCYYIYSIDEENETKFCGNLPNFLEQWESPNVMTALRPLEWVGL